MANLLNVSQHYDHLIRAGNDPVSDPAPLRAYMDKWDGDLFFEILALQKVDKVLEIGVGSGRLAMRTAPLVQEFHGIDLSKETLEKAKEHLGNAVNISLYHGDFLDYTFDSSFTVIYGSLVFFHFKDKTRAFSRAWDLLLPGGRFVLSIDKNQQDILDMGDYQVQLYPDKKEEILAFGTATGFRVEVQKETEFAWIFSFVKA